MISEILKDANPEVLTIVYDGKVGLEFKKAAERLLDDGCIKKLFCFDLNEFERPLKEVPAIISSAVETSDVLLILINKVEGEHNNFRKPLINMKYSFPLRVGSLLDAKPEHLKDIFAYDPVKIKELNQKIYDLFVSNTEVKIKTKKGTDLILKISDNYKWINQDADLSKVSPQHSLLAGEVYGYPLDVEGILVVDGVMGGEFSKFTLDDPLIIEISESKVKSFRSANKELEEKFKEHIEKYENADRVGELGFGTNYSLKKLYGILGIDEKFPGCHIAFGHPYSEKTGADWGCEVHVDCVIKNCSAWIGNRQVLENGKYKI